MQALKQSTATTILVGPVLDSSGAAVTTAVLADFNITKNGTSATLTGATVTHSHNGHYTIALTTGNTDTLGRLTVSVNNTAMAMAPFRYTVLTATAFDTLITNGTIAGTTSGRTITVDASGNLTVATNNDKTGYSLTQSFPSNFASLAITAGGAVTAGTVSDKTGYSLTQSFPANFGSLAITVGGAVTAGTVSDKTGYSLTAGTGLGNQTANITGNISGSVGSVTGNVGGNVTGSVGSISGVSFPTNFGSMAITVGGAVTAGTVSDKTGYSLTATTGLGNQTANITGNLSGSVGSVTSGVTVTTNNDKTGYSLATAPPTAAAIATAVLTTQMTESYAAVGTAPTLAQSQFAIKQHLENSAISGTTQTVYKIDGTTVAMTFTLDSATAPTSIARAT